MRIAIHGMGLSTPAGSSIEEHFNYLRSGATCIDSSQLPWIGLAAEEEAIIEHLRSESRMRHYDRSTLIAARCAQLAVGYSRGRDINFSDLGVIMGSARGPTSSLESAIIKHHLEGRVEAQVSPVTTGGGIASGVARYIGAGGPCFGISAACSTGLQAIATACLYVDSGVLSHCLVGSAEAANTGFMQAALDRAGVLTNSREVPYRCRPFSESAGGMVLSEGGFCLMLGKPKQESIHGFIVGFGSSTETATLAGISDSGVGLQRAIFAALNMANLTVSDIDLIVAHGSGTKKGDRAEYTAYQRVFGGRIPPLICPKWVLGHQLSASCGISLILGLEHLRINAVPKIPYDHYLNCREPTKPIQRALVSALGFGGSSSAVILSVV